MSQNTVNFNDSIPAAPSGKQNVTWQRDTSGRVTAHVVQVNNSEPGILPTLLGVEGKIPIDQGDGTVAWADPLVQGVYAPGTDCTTGGISGGPINPVLVGGMNPSNLLENITVDASGYLQVNIKAGGSGGGNAAAGLTGNTVPTSADYLGAEDQSGDLAGLLVESSSHPNLRTSIYNGTNEATVKAGNTPSADADVSLIVQLNPVQPNLDTALNVKAVAWDGTNVIQVKAGNTPSADADRSLIVQLNPVQPSLDTPLNVHDSAPASQAVTNAGTFAVQAAATEADGANVTLGAKADAKSTATDTTPITAMSVLKQISASVQSPPSQAVTNAGTFAVQAASTEADGANVTLGAKADAKSTATDTTPITAMSVLKQISASVQSPPSQAVTNAGTFAVQEATLDGCISGSKLAVRASAGDVVVEISDGSNIIGTTAHPVQTADQASGPVTPGTVAGKSELQGGVVATSAATGTVGQQMAIQLDVAGCVRINPAGQTGSFTTYHNSNPAQGTTSTTFTVPAGKKWRVKAAFIQAVTNGTTGARTMAFSAFDASSNNLASIYAANTQAASLTYNYTMGPSINDGIGSTNQVKFGIPEFSLGPGATVTLVLSGGVTGVSGDKLQLPTLTVEEYND